MVESKIKFIIAMTQLYPPSKNYGLYVGHRSEYQRRSVHFWSMKSCWVSIFGGCRVVTKYTIAVF